MNFYAAVSYELLGQAAHLYSSTKISLLNEALDCFVDCGAVLPEPLPLPVLPRIEPTPPPPSPPVHYSSAPRTSERNLLAFDGGRIQSPGRNSLVQSITRLIDMSLWNMEDDDPFMSGDENDDENGIKTPFMLSVSPLAMKPATKAEKDRLFRVMISPTKTLKVEHKEPIKQNTLMPSPLRVQKVSKGVETPLTKQKSLDVGNDSCSSRSSQGRNSTRPRPPPLPLRIIPATKLNIDASKCNKKNTAGSLKPPAKNVKHVTHTPKKPTNPMVITETTTPMSAAQIDRYNHAIELLRSQISMNINSIQQHVDRVLEIQRTRRSRRMKRSISFWSFNPVKSHDNGDHHHESDENEHGDGVVQDQDQEPVLDEFGNLFVKETKAQRISRLRSEGWETVGLRSPRSTWKGAQYYQELCAMAMSEMYLDC